MDPLLRVGKLPARSSSCRGGLTADPSMLLFTSIVKKMGLDISKMLNPSRAPLYGIILGMRLHHSGQWSCQSSLGRKITTAPSI
jgi:hypothetical protein